MTETAPAEGQVWRDTSPGTAGLRVVLERTAGGTLAGRVTANPAADQRLIDAAGSAGRRVARTYPGLGLVPGDQRGRLLATLPTWLLRRGERWLLEHEGPGEAPRTPVGGAR